MARFCASWEKGFFWCRFTLKSWKQSNTEHSYHLAYFSELTVDTACLCSLLPMGLIFPSRSKYKIQWFKRQLCRKNMFDAIEDSGKIIQNQTNNISYIWREGLQFQIFLEKLFSFKGHEFKFSVCVFHPTFKMSLDTLNLKDYNIHFLLNYSQELSMPISHTYVHVLYVLWYSWVISLEVVCLQGYFKKWNYLLLQPSLLTW